MALHRNELRELLKQVEQLKNVELDWSKHLDEVAREAILAKVKAKGKAKKDA